MRLDDFNVSSIKTAIVLEQKYCGRDVMWKRSVRRRSSVPITSAFRLLTCYSGQWKSHNYGSWPVLTACRECHWDTKAESDTFGGVELACAA